MTISFTGEWLFQRAKDITSRRRAMEVNSLTPSESISHYAKNSGG